MPLRPRHLLGYLALLLLIPAGLPAMPLPTLAEGLQIDPDRLSVSGISSGAYMALQLHVSHAAHIHGAGMIAGGPYRCAEGNYPGTWFDFSGLYAATHICTTTAPSAWQTLPPNLDFSLAETQRLAATGHIDSPTQLSSSHVWLFSGANDTTVPTRIMDTVAAYYQTFMPPGHIRYIQHPQASHAMITDQSGSACALNQPPYINDCDLDAAGDLLQHLTGTGQPKTTARPDHLHTFDQQAFFDTRDTSTSLHENGHIYIPSSCQQGERCGLHIALHGCQQNEDFIGDAFYTRSGYNEWAENNHLVILYPQTKAWTGGFFLDLMRNPKGCWDWWGYSGENYADKRGKQVQAIARMVNLLTGQTLLK